jgi:hypothetical protein
MCVSSLALFRLVRGVSHFQYHDKSMDQGNTLISRASSARLQEIEELSRVLQSKYSAAPLMARVVIVQKEEEAVDVCDRFIT